MTREELKQRDNYYFMCTVETGLDNKFGGVSYDIEELIISIRNASASKAKQMLLELKAKDTNDLSLIEEKYLHSQDYITLTNEILQHNKTFSMFADCLEYDIDVVNSVYVIHFSLSNHDYQLIAHLETDAGYIATVDCYSRNGLTNAVLHEIYNICLSSIQQFDFSMISES